GIVLDVRSGRVDTREHGLPHPHSDVAVGMVEAERVSVDVVDGFQAGTAVEAVVDEHALTPRQANPVVAVPRPVAPPEGDTADLLSGGAPLPIQLNPVSNGTRNDQGVVAEHADKLAGAGTEADVHEVAP